MTDFQLCEKRVWRDFEDGGKRYEQCSRHAKIERFGEWYCKQHDPAANPKWLANKKVIAATQAKADAVQAVIDEIRNGAPESIVLWVAAELVTADQALTAAIKEREELS